MVMGEYEGEVTLSVRVRRSLEEAGVVMWLGLWGPWLLPSSVGLEGEQKVTVGITVEGKAVRFPWKQDKAGIVALSA